MKAFLVVIAYVGGVLWILCALARMQVAADASQRDMSQLRSTLTAAGLKLMSDLETAQKLEDEIKRVRESVAQARREQVDRHAAIARSAPPPSPEVYVTSEYPASRRDTPWIAEFVRDTEVPPQPGECQPMSSLIWAGTHATALSRARQIVGEHRTYDVASVRPLM